MFNHTENTGVTQWPFNPGFKDINKNGKKPNEDKRMVQDVLVSYRCLCVNTLLNFDTQ